FAETGMLARQQRAAVLAQVERVERVALGGEALGHVALEEVVDEAMHVEDSAARRVARRQAHQRRHHTAVVVLRRRQLERLEAGQQAIRLPGHAASEPMAHALVPNWMDGLFFYSTLPLFRLMKE